MLIVTRRVGERLVIGEDGEVVITILETRGNQVRVGVDAPRDIPVHREEIYNRILDGNQGVEEDECIMIIKDRD